jgi:hypothetical protein
MKNLRRLALVSSIAALSAVAFNPTAQAEPATQDINFAGTVPAVCTFSNTTAGSLVSANNRLKAHIPHPKMLQREITEMKIKGSIKTNR